MKISIVGTGYVGLVTGTCFADTGVNVTCVDIDEKKINNLKKGVVPIYEPGLETMIKNNVEKGQIAFFNQSERKSGSGRGYLYCCWNTSR
ncbi:3-hydroxyacyl-CoA dehydrogenase NAD-binding domain-containing protein [Marinilabilia salmonicolor]|uniref:3-hydroxyacyl-CoA dehydrogenase NAD-binding domain-containing protein n=1 Tax=Marinilabilia salmonicolor TaxID=989 RepID=UPI001F16420E|nr:3-hydroxyacyl-CoA dehydrogenase NAD-binding domain-containing protein [Marinilabilia salmonicolor]